MQSVFLYIPSIYPRYAASIFAANNLARSLFAFAAVMYTRPMIEGIGVGPGMSIIGGLTVICGVGLVVLYYCGKGLRERSKFALS
jgi:MFS transporter, DHA1 family, multidrug resistance protein